MKKRRNRLFMLAGMTAVLLFTKPVIASETGSLDLNQIAQVIMNSDASLPEDSSDTGKVNIDDITRLINEIDLEAVKEAAVYVGDFLDSEDFKSLMSYKEVRELGETAAEKIVDFVDEDPELTEKILVALGMDEAGAAAALDAVSLIRESGFEVKPVLREILRQTNIE